MPVLTALLSSRLCVADVPLSSVMERMNIRQALQHGDVQGAIDKVNALDAQVA